MSRSPRSGGGPTTCGPSAGGLRMWRRLGTACVLGVAVAVGAACLGGPPSVPPAPPSPSPSPQAWPPSPVAEASPSRVGRARVTGAGAEGVNLRAEPSAAGARLKGLFDGVELEVIGPDSAADGRAWRHVRDPADRSEGWVASEFLAPATGAASPTPTG